MNKEELKSILDKHAKWLACEAGGERADFSRRDLRGCDLSHRDLCGACFSGCDLSNANLRHCDLSDADLSNANLSDANLRHCDLRGCDLSDADLSNANLSDANLRHCDLRGCDIRGCDIRGCDLRGCDLRDVTGVPSDPALLRRVCQESLKTGQIDMGRWHTCETTHCLAGWAIHLSGHVGQVMERLLGPATAGALLIPDASHMFNATNESARAWCQKWLEEHPEEVTS
jgi:uncharacterized protein YjbI with pentapeptide repeats